MTIQDAWSKPSPHHRRGNVVVLAAESWDREMRRKSVNTFEIDGQVILLVVICVIALIAAFVPLGTYLLVGIVAAIGLFAVFQVVAFLAVTFTPVRDDVLGVPSVKSDGTPSSFPIVHA